MKKRFFSTLLALLMMFSLVPVSIFAEDTDEVRCGSYPITVAAEEMKSFAFTPEEDGYYLFYTTGTGEANICGELRDSEDMWLAGDEGDGGDPNFSFAHYLEAGQTYTLKVYTWSDSDETFTLVIDRHTAHAVADGWDYDNWDHWRYCKVCYAEIGERESHTYVGDCCECGALNPNHTHMPSDEMGSCQTCHWVACSLCWEQMGPSQAHTFDENGVCTECGYIFADTDHEHEVWDEIKCNEWEHWDSCSYCGTRLNVQEHTYDPAYENGNYCTVCNYLNPNHTHVAGTYFDAYENADEYDEETGAVIPVGHYQRCDICYERMSAEPEEHVYQNHRCVCGAVDPSHTCIPRVFHRSRDYKWTQDGLWDEETWSFIDKGHCQRCAICDKVLATEPHDFANGICTKCGAIDPDHEHVAGRWMQKFDYSEDQEWGTDAGHYQICQICYEPMNEIVLQHTDADFVNGVCTKCGAIDPDHEHEFGYWTTVWDINEETGVETDAGHRAVCAICGYVYGDPQLHNFDGTRCTVCGTPDPAHTHVAEAGWRCSGEYDGHYRICQICGEIMGEICSHSYNGARCVDCGAPNPNHECVAESEWSYGEGIGHYKLCAVCGRMMGEEYPHIYEDGRCKECGAQDPEHVCVPGELYYWWEYNYDSGKQIQLGHARSCAICGQRMEPLQEHTYDGTRCTVCGAPDPRHECVMGDGYAFDESEHWSCCDICGEMMGEPEAHQFDEYGVCTICHMLNPSHKHVFSRWEPTYDNIDGEWVTTGHFAYCSQCKGIYGDSQPHDFSEGNYCKECGELNPNHEHVFDGWEVDENYDEEQHTFVDSGFHRQHCALCHKLYGDPVAHEYVGDYCKDCSSTKPDHVHETAENWSVVWKWNDAEERYVDAGHAHCCTVCGEPMDTPAPHVFDGGNYCTVCGAINPDHTCVAGRWVDAWDGCHMAICAICEMYMDDTAQPHTFDHDRCTVCGAGSDAHVHEYTLYADQGSHSEKCRICEHVRNRAEHTFDANGDANGVCTVCGWIKDQPTAIVVSEDENKNLLLDITFADDTTRNLTVTDLYFRWSGEVTDGRQYNGDTIYTADAILGPEYYFVTDSDGSFYVCYDFFGVNPVYSNPLSGGSEWFTVYQAAANENITGFTLNRDNNGIWTAEGKSYDGWDVTMTLDGKGNVLSYTTNAVYDVNGDGFVDENDLAVMLRHVAKIEIITDEALLAQLDIDGSGAVDAADVTVFAQLLSK